MQAGSLEEPIAVAGAHAHVEGATVAVDEERYLDPGLAERPDLAEQVRELAHLGSRDRKHDVAGPKIGAFRRPSVGETDDDDSVLDLGGVDTEPRSWGMIGAAKCEEVVENRRKEIDRHDHVEVIGGAPFGGLLDLQRTDPEQGAGGAEPGGAPPNQVQRC